MRRTLFWLALGLTALWLVSRPVKCERRCDPICAQRNGCV